MKVNRTVIVYKK